MIYLIGLCQYHQLHTCQCEIRDSIKSCTDITPLRSLSDGEDQRIVFSLMDISHGQLALIND